MSGKANAVVGLQYGDEGKGKVVDLLTRVHPVVVRANGGANAGHTIVLPSGTKLALHQLPSGVANPEALNVIAHGVFLDPAKLVEEMAEGLDKGLIITPEQLAISTACHMVLPIHKLQDAAREAGDKGQGSTKAGIAYVASSKALREGVRAEAILHMSEQQLSTIAIAGLEAYVSKDEAAALAKKFTAAARKLIPYLTDTVALLHSHLAKNDILLEGAQAFGLDINHGKYPYTTSSETTIQGLLSGSGINPKQAGTVIGVAKAIPSKVGGGVFVTKITDGAIAGTSRGHKGQVDAEYGATTGREREVGYLDLVALKRAIMVNGVDELALTKFDCLGRHGKTTNVAVAYDSQTLDGKTETFTTAPAANDELGRCKPVYKTFGTWGDSTAATTFSQLPKAAKDYVNFIENYLGIPVSILGTGPEREQIIIRNSNVL